ncbi:unnamed protein product [Peniophora sp. CBMAI 1063]|nr:unnamed protein product [Peniophora sp. CBMAI 1063]
MPTSLRPVAGPSRILHRSFTKSYTPRNAPRDHSASAKLFADAEAEESAPAPREPKLPHALREAENWTGDERMEDAVLRMLVDKYKPLRSGPVRSADEKLRSNPPEVASSHAGSGLGLSEAEEAALAEDIITTATRSMSAPAYATSTAAYQPSPYYKADTPLLPAIEGHKPWHTTYVVPSHSSSSIKYGAIPPQSSQRTRSTKPSLEEMDDKTRRKVRETAKRAQVGKRLGNARESTLDYKLGLRGKMPGGGRANPTTVKGWVGLVEDRIERARQAGHFNNVKGRGQPIQRTADEGNPFLPREEFLMNRIVQRQGAAPPWVELQNELEIALSSYRDLLRQSWVRRVVRMLPLHHHPKDLERFTLDDIRAYRDADWIAREASYHNVAIDELNALVRKYNGVAPAVVRRPYYILSTELERAYNDAAEEILATLAERAHSSSSPFRGRGLLADESAGGGGGGPASEEDIGLWDVVVGWFRKEPKRAGQ